MESLRCDVGGTRSAWKAGVWFWMVRCLLDVQMEMSICSVFRGARERSGWKYKFGCGWKAGFSWWVKHKKIWCITVGDNSRPSVLLNLSYIIIHIVEFAGVNGPGYSSQGCWLLERNNRPKMELLVLSLTKTV